MGITPIIKPIIKAAPVIDYRKLLINHIANVIFNEGASFINGNDRNLSKEENEIMIECEKEAFLKSKV